MTLGVGLNFAAIVANGGFIPVSAEARLRAGSASTIAAFRLLPRVQTELWFLTDLIPVPWLHMVVSAGDVFIALGLFILVAEAIKGKRLASINCSEPEGCESDSNIVP